MSIFSDFWLSQANYFDKVQGFFNKGFWQVFLIRFGDFKGKVVLDLACGTGELSDCISPKKYLGIDINPSYIRYAKKNRQKENVQFALEDITKYQTTEKIDCAFLISAAHHLSDSQLKKTTKNLLNSKVSKFIIVDGFPIGLPAPILRMLDDKLGGGKYFRSIDRLKEVLLDGNLVSKVKLEMSGEFTSKSRYYKYIFLVLIFI